MKWNPHYAHVRFPDGKETTVSVRHLALPGITTDKVALPVDDDSVEPATDAKLYDLSNNNSPATESLVYSDTNLQQSETLNNEQSTTSEVLRRSGRIRRPPERLDL